MGIFETIGGLAGSLISSSANKKIAQQQMQMQEHLAKNQVQIRAEDAKKAGVGTLAALGMQPMNYNPVTVGSTDWGKHGAGIGRAVDAAVSRPEQSINHALQAAQVENMRLQNDLLKTQVVGSQIQLNRQAGTPPGIPDPNPTKDKPEKLTESTIFGIKLKPNPNFSDAQTIQNRYGEPAEYPYFPLVAGADFHHNMKRFWANQSARTTQDQQNYYRSRQRSRPSGGSGW